MPNLMKAPLLGDKKVQREEAQEDSNGCESRGSKELGTEGRVSRDSKGLGRPTSWCVPLCLAFYIGHGVCTWFPMFAK